MDGRIYHLKKLFLERLDHPWTIEEMACGFDLSPSHFHRLFKTHQGISPLACLTGMRLDRVRYLLETTFIQMKQIGLQTGMLDDSHLTRDFKKRFGMTPTAYPRQCWEKIQADESVGKE